MSEHKCAKFLELSFKVKCILFFLKCRKMLSCRLHDVYYCYSQINCNYNNDNIKWLLQSVQSALIQQLIQINTKISKITKNLKATMKAANTSQQSKPKQQVKSKGKDKSKEKMNQVKKSVNQTTKLITTYANINQKNNSNVVNGNQQTYYNLSKQKKVENAIISKKQESKPKILQKQQQKKIEKHLNNNQLPAMSINTFSNNKANIKQNEKIVKNQLDQIEHKLKNRDISAQQLHAIVSNKVLNTLSQAYEQYHSLHPQISRIILQIYSHYPIRNKLYINNINNNESIASALSYRIIPLLVHNYGHVNESAAIQCVQGLLKQGNVDIMQCINNIQFAIPNSNNSNKMHSQKQMLVRNIIQIIRKWSQTTNSIFMNGLLQLIFINLQYYYKNMTNINKNNQTDIIYNTTIIQFVTQITNKLSKLIQSQNNTNIYVTLPKLNKQIKDIIINYYKLYINQISNTLNIINSNKDIIWLLPKLFIFSICDNYCYLNKYNKYNKCINNNKSIFTQIVQYSINLLDNNNIYINQHMNLALSLFYPFSSLYNNVQIKQFKFPLNSAQCMLLYIVKHHQILLDIMNINNIEDNTQQQVIELVLQWIFNLAVFCDEYKKKYKLETLLANIQMMHIVDKNGSDDAKNQVQFQFSFQVCESILYKLLLSIEKFMPKFPLKYYADLYIDRPGIFHLYFLDQVLLHRQAYEIKNFMVDLIEKWGSIEMRDFNILGYVCKFITHFLGSNQNKHQKNEKKVKIQEGHKILLTFFRELSPQTLINLNKIFYQPSFSETTSPQTQVNHYENHTSRLSISNSLPSTVLHQQTMSLPSQPQPIVLPSNLPPFTQSSHQQQSQLKSCGYSYSDKTIFLDRHFYLPEQLLNWATFLDQIYDDHYYYHCKYFYYLLASAYAVKSNSNRISNYIKKNKTTNNVARERRSLNPVELHEELSQNVSKVIQIWEDSIHKNKVSQIYSIFHMLSCWAFTFAQIANTKQQINRINHSLTSAHVKTIIRILLENQQKLLCLPSIYTQNWKQAIKQMQTNMQLFENYKKQQNKVKNRQAFLLRCIVRFFENISTTKIFELLPKTISDEEIIQIIQKYSVYSGGIVCWKSVRVFSAKASRNIFLDEALKIVNCKYQGNNGKIVRKKLQLYRQLIFSFIQQQKIQANQNQNTIVSNKPNYPLFNINKSSKTTVDNNSNTFNSQQSASLGIQNSNNSQSQQNINNIHKVIKFHLKLSINDILAQCINVINAIIQFKVNNDNKTQNKFYLKNDKQELINKHLAMQIIFQVFNNSSNNKKCFKMIYQLINQHRTLMQKFKKSLVFILFRDPLYVTKYERRLILSLRRMCLNLTANDGCLQTLQYYHQFMKIKQKNKIFIQQNICIGILSKKQIFLTLWHFALDEQIQLRIFVLSIITNIYKSEQFSQIKKQWIYCLAILTLIRALQPKAKLKLYVQKGIQYYCNKIMQKYPNSAPSFLLYLSLTIGFLVYNSKINLPCLDIFDAYCQFCIQGNKDLCYLIVSALDIIDREGWKFKTIDFFKQKEENFSLGNQLKLYYMNIKEKRGWIVCKQKRENYNYIQIQHKSDLILKYLKQSIYQKVKNIKFLKVKKQAIFSIQQMLKHGEVAILQKMSQVQLNQRKERRQKNKGGSGSFGDFDAKQSISELTQDINDNNQYFDF